MSVIIRDGSRGDTLIEVLFAITIFSLVAVGGISIMNQGAATSQRALEISMVRNEMDAQAETLRFLNASYVAAYQKGIANYTGAAAQWKLIKTNTASVTNSSDFGAGVATCPTPPQFSFILNAHNATYVPPAGKLFAASTYSQVQYQNDNVTRAEGIWIEAVSAATETTNSQSNASYVDFHIRACWSGPGNSIPVTLGTIVRLYEPR